MDCQIELPLLLAGLPDKFSPMIVATEHSDIGVTMNSIKSKVLDMDFDVSKSGSAFASKAGFQRNKQHNVGYIYTSNVKK